MWILYHPHLIQSPIANDHIKVKLDNENGLTKTELRKIILFFVSVHKLHIDTTKRIILESSKRKRLF